MGPKSYASVVLALALIGCSPVKGLVDGGFGEIDDDLIDDEGSEGAVNNDDTGNDSSTDDTGSDALADSDGDTIPDVEEDSPHERHPRCG